MEGIHGVDVSWLHHSNKDNQQRTHAPTSPGTARDPPPPVSHSSQHAAAAAAAAAPSQASTPATTPHPDTPKTQRTTNGTHDVKEEEAPASPVQSEANNATSQPKTIQKRPSLLGRSSSDKSGTTPPDSRSPLRRGSWVSSITSKFSSSQQAAAANAQANAAATNNNGQNGKPQANGGVHGGLPLINPYSPGLGTPLPPTNGNQQQQQQQQQHQGGERMEPYVPQPPETSRTSFLSNALRRLSSGSQAPPPSKVTGNGGMCPRRVMNIDPNRERCLVPELDGSKLRRVAFCVDVEIAGTPRYRDDGDSPERKKRSKDKKLKERGEGEALKHPDAVASQKEKDGVVQVSNEEVGTDEAPNPEGTVREEGYSEEKKAESSKKKEKKKRSEAERKERKEKKRRRAEESGSVPMELTRDDDGGSSTPQSAESRPTKPQDRPTTDPLRIYRRCCQLRETPILKRITEQLQEAARGPIETPGVVSCLNLTGSRLTLADMNTLGDWLAVVPVKKLLMEDAELTDEGLRVILAGLLAARAPDYNRRSFISTKTNSTRSSSQDRSGVVEKLSLKSNPKITREGWKHISLFIYMCRSLKALDVSNIPFPQPRVPPKTHPSEQKKQIRVPVDDIADILNKSMSERLGGARLEELLMTDCGLNAQNIRKIIDGVIVSGIQRLGLSHNSIDAEGMEHVVRYIRSGVCHGLDLGGNDLRDRMEQLCDGLHERCPLWALSLAACNLSPDSLRLLMPKLVHLQNFRFIDLSHNRDLFATEPSALAILRKYIPQLRFLKRIHLEDVSLTPAQAIGLAEVLPECPQLAHITVLENPELTALASASDEASQEEACALYASLMVAVRVSDSIICVDVDVPSQDSSEVVKALAKQVVAYCLRNMEHATAHATAGLVEGGPGAAPSGAENVEIPEVLLHLVGHGEDSDGTDDDSAAPDEDYIVGGTGLVKALNYCLLEKASDNLRRKSMPSSRPGSGTATPRSSSRIGNRETRSAKAKSMSKDLLQSARKIRARLQPALAREARAGDEMAYKRLLFLDSTLQGIIQRFEDEYPECRVHSKNHPPTASEISAALANSIGSLSDRNSVAETTKTEETGVSSAAASLGKEGGASSSFAAADSGSDDDYQDLPPLGLRSRHNSDVSLASRAQTLEEGHVHRLGQSVRREILRPQTEDHLHGTTGEEAANEPTHLQMLREQLFKLSGGELRDMVVRDGWEETVRKIGANAEELRELEKERPEEFEQWRETQIAAQVNAGRLEKSGRRLEKRDGVDENAIED